MGRGKALRGEEPWKEFNLTKGAYYQRMRRGVPFDAVLHKGRKKDVLPDLEPIKKVAYGRFSGLTYENSPERLRELKKKYRHGVTAEILQEMFL